MLYTQAKREKAEPIKKVYDNVLCFGLEAEKLALDHQRMILSVKKQFIKEFGAKHESEISSRLDSPVFIYYDFKNADNEKKKLFVKNSKNNKSVLEVFDNKDLSRTSIPFLMERLAKSVYSVVNGEETEYQYGNLVTVFDKNQDLHQVCYLSSRNASDSTIAHELLHAVSTKLLSKNPYTNEEVPCEKTGFEIIAHHKNGAAFYGDVFGEFFTDFLAEKVVNKLTSKDLSFGNKKEKKQTLYSLFFPLLSDFFENNLDVLKEGFIGNLDAVFKRFNKENFISLLKSVDKLYSLKPSVENISLFYSIKDEEENKQKQLFLKRAKSQAEVFENGEEYYIEDINKISSLPKSFRVIDKEEIYEAFSNVLKAIKSCEKYQSTMENY